MIWQLSTGSWLQIQFLSRTLNWQLSARCHFDEAIIRYIWNELTTVNWQLAANSISIKNFELATVSQMPFRWSYHKVYMKWIGNCQLSASCQFDRALIRNIWNELATVNWQLAANSISIKNVELATVNCQPAIIRYIWNELATVNWQLGANSISIKNFELATVNCKPAANSKELP